jgi:proteasome lid subunit RPN8/RPN11
MTTFHLQVLPPENPVPTTANMPIGNVTRWISSYEKSGFQPLLPVFVAKAAHTILLEHSTSDLEREVGGILVGNWSINPESQQQFTFVETALPARFTRHGSVYVTFTQDSLVDLHAEMDENYPGKQIVGWYHTHPGMGIFLSPYDTWLHRHFFPEPWQVALVIEPHSITCGFFIRQADGTLDPERYFGFYELDGDTCPDLLHWTNMHQEMDAANIKGVELHE